MMRNTDDIVEFNCTGYLRLILMLFVCFWAFDCPEPTGILRTISGFAIPAFFVLSGYYVLDNNRLTRAEKTLRKIKRTALCFAFVFLFYLAINVALIFLYQLKFEFTKRILFEFVVLNLWPLPIGDNIWFIQAMLYAYIIIFILDKLKLIRFYKIILVVLILIMLLTGEFAGAIRFGIFGYRYISGNWLTRALPYILIGRLLREKNRSLMKVKFWKYIIAFFVGAGLVFLEVMVLGVLGVLNYKGHLIGFGVMAVAVCGLAISLPIGKANRLIHFDSAISGLIYVLMNPVYCLLVFFLGTQHLDFLKILGGLTAFLTSFLLALILCGIPPVRFIFTNWDMRLADAVVLDDDDDDEPIQPPMPPVRGPRIEAD